MHHETNHTQTADAAAVQPDSAAVSTAPKLPQQEAVSAPTVSTAPKLPQQEAVSALTVSTAPKLPQQEVVSAPQQTVVAGILF
jgi:hypothetical protein